jgi:hypothetical protein
MSLINDYSIKAMAEQRQRDLLAEAAASRLAAMARANRPDWWRRLIRNWRHTPGQPANAGAGRRLSAQGHAYADIRPDQPTSLRTEPRMRRPAVSRSGTAVAR